MLQTKYDAYSFLKNTVQYQNVAERKCKNVKKIDPRI